MKSIIAVRIAQPTTLRNIESHLAGKYDTSPIIEDQLKRRALRALTLAVTAFFAIVILFFRILFAIVIFFFRILFATVILFYEVSVVNFAFETSRRKVRNSCRKQKKTKNGKLEDKHQKIDKLQYNLLTRLLVGKYDLRLPVELRLMLQPRVPLLRPLE